MLQYLVVLRQPFQRHRWTKSISSLIVAWYGTWENYTYVVIHCAVSFSEVVEQFNSTAKLRPISEFYGSNFPFFCELKCCFPWPVPKTSKSLGNDIFLMMSIDFPPEIQKKQRRILPLFAYSWSRVIVAAVAERAEAQRTRIMNRISVIAELRWLLYGILIILWLTYGPSW